MVLELVFTAIVAASLISATGAFFLAMSAERAQRITPYLISLSAGTIFGGVFIHLVYKLANGLGYTRFTGLLVLSGMGGSLVLERLVHWHCHDHEHHVEAFSYVLVAGDAVHNVLDGILIATSFLAGIPSGMAATVAVMAHKVPKEAGDFGVLLESGFSRQKALIFNVAVNIFMFAGAASVFLLSAYSSGVNALLLPLVIGNFVYIAGSDLLPRFKEDEDILLHMGMFALGVVLMYSIPIIKSAVL
jgi:zinc and cadmium transporter